MEPGVGVAVAVGLGVGVGVGVGVLVGEGVGVEVIVPKNSAMSEAVAAPWGKVVTPRPSSMSRSVF